MCIRDCLVCMGHCGGKGRDGNVVWWIGGERAASVSMCGALWANELCLHLCVLHGGRTSSVCIYEWFIVRERLEP